MTSHVAARTSRSSIFDQISNQDDFTRSATPPLLSSKLATSSYSPPPFATSRRSSWLQWCWWLLGWTYIVPVLGLLLTFFLSWLVFLPCVLFLLFFSLGKKMLGFGFVCTTFLLVPLLKAFRYTPGIESGVNLVLRWTFIAWFYALVFFEKLLRWILKHFVGHHKDTSRPYSLVNVMDPYFDGFCSLSSASSSAFSPSCTVPPTSSGQPGDVEEAMEHAYNESQRATEAEQEQEKQDQQDIITQEHEFSNFEYSHTKAYSLALAAKMAYENSDIIKCEVKKWGFPLCRVARYQNSKAYIAANDDMVLLVFCGTHPLNLRNYITDLQAHLVNAGPLGYVHSGFLEALGLRHVDEEELEEAERQYRQEWHKTHHAQHQSQSSSCKHASSSSSSSSPSFSRARNFKLSLMRGSSGGGRRRSSTPTLPVVMRRESSTLRRYSPTKLLRALPSLPQSLWSLMRLVALWHRRQLLRVTGLHDYHEKWTAAPSAPMYHQVIKILDELGVLQAYPFAAAAAPSAAGKRPPPKRKLWVAGHSLGGALANLFAAQMVVDYPGSEDAIGGIYTYGQPRVGDLQFSQYVNEKVGRRFFRFVNGNDLIPRLPLGIPSWLIRRLLKRAKKEKDGTLIDVPDIKSIRNSLVCYLAGVATNHETSYKHAGQLKYIDYGGNIIEPDKLRHVIYLHLVGLCKLRIFKHLQRDTWLRLAFRMVLPFFMNDHLICDYARAIKDRIEEEKRLAEEEQRRDEPAAVVEEGRASSSTVRGWFDMRTPAASTGPVVEVAMTSTATTTTTTATDGGHAERGRRDPGSGRVEQQVLGKDSNGQVHDNMSEEDEDRIVRRKTADEVINIGGSQHDKKKDGQTVDGLVRRRRWSATQL